VKILIILMGLLMPITLVAQDKPEENFNRLFTTSAERARLDLARKQGKLFTKSVDASDSVSIEGQSHNKPSPLKVSGIIMRADGKAQVWISGKPLYLSLKQLNADKNSSSDLLVPLSGKTISLKPGQVLSNGKAKEAYYFVTRSSSSSQVSVASQSLAESVIQAVNNTSAVSASSSSASSRAGEHVKTKTP